MKYQIKYLPDLSCGNSYPIATLTHSNGHWYMEFDNSGIKKSLENTDSIFYTYIFKDPETYFDKLLQSLEGKKPEDIDFVQFISPNLIVEHS